MSATTDHTASAPAPTPKKSTASPKKKAGAAKSTKHATTAKKTASHPTYQAMVKSTVINLKEPKGSSKAAILKYILQHYKVGDNVKQVTNWVKKLNLFNLYVKGECASTIGAQTRCDERPA